jgi:hypothetical protein
MLKILVLLSVSFVISSCNTFDPPLVVPVYGHIDSIHFSVPLDSTAKEGSGSNSIPYAWVYLDDIPVGAFQMPCTFPMVASNGPHIIEVYPGIVPVNVNSPASIYSFYQSYSINMNLQQGITYKIKPTSLYYPWVQFPYQETFGEDPGGPPLGIINYHGGGSNASAGSTTTMTVVNGNLAFNKGRSGMVVVNGTNDYYIGVTNPPVTLPYTGVPVYVELNYRSTAQFAVGMFESDTMVQVQPVIIYPSATWQKMYFSLSSTLSEYSIGSDNIYFSISLDTYDGHTSDTLLLANIKIVD